MSDVDPDLALSCPICMETYSDTRYPIAPYCGHSICKECGDERKSNQCISCTEHCFYDGINRTLPWPSNDWKKNYALFDLCKLYTLMAEERNELKSKYESAIPFLPNDIDYLECSKCKTMEKREKLKICESCVKEVIVDWKNMTEDEIFPFILCAFCCHEHHIGHTLTKYLPWKLDHLRTSTVSDGKSTVASMDELCVYEFEKGKEQLEEWNEKFDVFRTVSINTNSYRDELSIANTLKLEADLVTRVSEDCLPPLRKYRKVVTDATKRLEKFVEEIAQGKVDSEKSEAVKEVEGISDLLNKSSKVVVSKERIRELEKHIEKLNKIPAKRLVWESAEHVQRLSTTMSDHVWTTGPRYIDLLYMTVSHTIDLLGVEMYRRNCRSKYTGPSGSKGHLKISNPTTTFGEVDFIVLDSSEKDALQLVAFKKSVRLFPSTKYLLELTFDKITRLFYGSGGSEKIVSFIVNKHGGTPSSSRVFCDILHAYWQLDWETECSEFYRHYTGTVCGILHAYGTRMIIVNYRSEFVDSFGRIVS